MVNALGDLSLEETQQAVLYLLALMSDKMARLDTADRMTVNVETGPLPPVSLHHRRWPQ